MPVYILFLLLFFIPISSFAAKWEALHELLPSGAQISYIIIDPAKNNVEVQWQANTLRTPASIQKLLTATAAKLYLGEQFRYQTNIEGNRAKIKDNRYQGSLTLRFVGDPTLLRNDIHNMLRALKKLGIREVTGDFLINQSHFDGYQWSNGQAWNDLGVCYTSPISAIIVNKNCVLGNLSLTKKIGHKAKLFIPNYEPITVSSDVDIVSDVQRKEQFCDLNVTLESGNRYHLWGCLVNRNTPLPLSFAVNDPFDYAREIVNSELQKVGIKVRGEIRLDNSNKSANTKDLLVTHQSPLLDELLKTMMKESDNLIADSLFKTLGANYFNRSGNFSNGAEAMKAILLAKGLDLKNAYIADGSGLSRHNLMSAELFMSVLEYIYHNEQRLHLLSTFSIAGVDGTLQYNRAVLGKLLREKVIAKTGSMKGVTNILGVLQTPHGDRLFVVIINGYNESEESLEKQQASNQEMAKVVFLKAFLEKMFQND